MGLTQSIKAVGKLAIVCVAAFFLFQAVVRGAGDLRNALTDPDWPALTGMFVSAMVAMIWIAMVWVIIIHSLGSKFPTMAGVAIYFVGESTKYLPGAFWPVVGRGELATRRGLGRPIAYASTMLSIVFCFLLAGLLASALLSPFAFFGEIGSRWPLWLLGLLPLGLGALHPRSLGFGLRIVTKVLHREIPVPILPWRVSAGLVAAYLPAWVCVGLTSWFASQALDSSVGFGPIAFAAALAWVAGFLALPAPSGLGVREAVFAALLAGVIGNAAASAIALMARVAFVFADAVGAVVGAFSIHYSKTLSPETDSRNA